MNNLSVNSAAIVGFCGIIDYFFFVKRLTNWNIRETYCIANFIRPSTFNIIIN